MALYFPRDKPNSEFKYIIVNDRGWLAGECSTNGDTVFYPGPGDTRRGGSLNKVFWCSEGSKKEVKFMKQDGRNVKRVELPIN